MECIAVTGATGFLGESLVGRLVHEGKLVHAIARNEGKLNSLKEKFPSITIFPCPIEDEFLVRKAVHACDGIFHLASFKNVGLAEQHPLKTVQTNILGTMNLLKLTLEYPNIRFMVSAGTDKAGKISGVYGASRLIMESLVDEYRKVNPYGCRFRVIRYGNILNSTSSVVEKWKEALVNGRELIVTEPGATRFFITRDEAINFLFEALASETEEPFIPEMRALSIQDLLEFVIAKYGNGIHARIVKIGLQKGENLHESGKNGQSSEVAARWTKDELMKHI